MTQPGTYYDLDQLRGLVDGNEEALRHMMVVFTESSPEILVEMNRHFENADWPSLANAAHKLKSSIDLFNISELRPSIREIESLAKAEAGKTALQGLLERLNVVMKTVFEDMKRALS